METLVQHLMMNVAVTLMVDELRPTLALCK